MIFRTFAKFHGFKIFVLLAILRGPLLLADCLDDPFIKDLKAQGDTFRAMTVLKEKEFNQRGSSQGFGCARLILGEYLRFHEFDLADDWLGRMYSHYSRKMTEEFGPQYRLKAELSFLFGNPDEVENRLQLQSESAANIELKSFAKAYKNPHLKEAGCNTQACHELNQILHEESTSSRKSPTLALALGVIPGVGQMYAGRVMAGVGSFILNSLLIGTTVYAVTRHEYAFSIFSGTMAAGFYFGSMYGGYEAAMRFNDQSDEQARTRIRGINLKMDLLRLSL